MKTYIFRKLYTLLHFHHIHILYIGEKTVFCLCSICHNHISYMCKDYRSILIPINTLNSLHRSETACEIQLNSTPYINLFPFGKGTKSPAL